MSSRSVATTLVSMGWIATAALSVAALGAIGCASGRRAEPVTTTNASNYMPGDGELPIPTEQRKSRGPCGTELVANIDFARRNAVLPPGAPADLDRWAKCLNEPALEEHTVVLVGKDEVLGPRLFKERANQVRNALIFRGVDPRRLIVARSDATSSGPPTDPNTVRLEVTHLTTIREFGPPVRRVRRPVPLL